MVWYSREILTLFSITGVSIPGDRFFFLPPPKLGPNWNQIFISSSKLAELQYFYFVGGSGAAQELKFWVKSTQCTQLNLPGVTATQRDQTLTQRLNQSQKHKPKDFYAGEEA